VGRRLWLSLSAITGTAGTTIMTRDHNSQEDTQVVFFKKNPTPPEKIKTLVPLLKLLSIPAGVFLILLIIQNIWVAFIVGAVVLLSTRFKAISQEITEELIPKPQIPKRTIEVVVSKIVVYAILFYYIFIPAALYLQQQYKIILFDKQTYNYFVSNKNEN
jgi:hypothetical protein